MGAAPDIGSVPKHKHKKKHKSKSKTKQMDKKKDKGKDLVTKEDVAEIN